MCPADGHSHMHRQDRPRYICGSRPHLALVPNAAMRPNKKASKLDCFVYAKQRPVQIMEQETTPFGMKSESRQFLSPVLELTQSLQSLRTTR